MKMLPLLCGALTLLVSPALSLEWMTDLPAAGQKAAAEGKALLVDFTGSDWCGWCIRLRKQVLDTPEFAEFSADKFIPVEVDVPQNPNFPAELRKTNEGLCETYKVQGFPTVLVMAPDGTVVGGFGGGQPNLDAVRGPLESGAAAAAKYAEVQPMSDGPEKALALMEIYKAIPEDVRENAIGLRDRIAAMDTTDACGLQHELQVAEQRNAIRAELMKATELSAMLTVINGWLEGGKLFDENKSDAYNIKAQVLLTMAQTEEDVAAAKEAALAAADATPGMTPEMRAKIEQAFSDPQVLLKQAASVRERMKK